MRRPHFGQTVSRQARTFSRLIFCFRGIRRPGLIYAVALAIKVGASDPGAGTDRLRRLLRNSRAADEPSRQIAFEDRLRPIRLADRFFPDYDHAYRPSCVVQDRGA